MIGDADALFTMFKRLRSDSPEPAGEYIEQNRLNNSEGDSPDGEYGRHTDECPEREDGANTQARCL